VAAPKAEDADQALLKRVSRTLMTAQGELPGFDAAPVFLVFDSDDVNAFATSRRDGTGPEAKIVPVVIVLRGFLKQAVRDDDDPEGDEDRLALAVGHELSHLSLGHVSKPKPGSTELLRTAFGRQKEMDADRGGAALVLRAGYSVRRGSTAFTRMRRMGLNYSSFEGLSVDHPSWDDRLAILDKEQAQLWKAMAAFENGIFFLGFEQYGSAETCFAAVTREFPKCPEAWANLGAARLMRYCDGLTADDLRGRAIGQPAVAAFYHRPASLEATIRGTDERLWGEAVEALRKALALDPSASLPRANLGLAYLLDPSGPRANEAADLFRKAAGSAAKDSALSPLARLAVGINAAVAERAAGRPAEAIKRLDEIEAQARERREGLPGIPATASVLLAYRYNRAFLLADSAEEEKKKAAEKMLKMYLTLVEPSSAWWPLAYERYQSLCTDLKHKAEPKEVFAGPAREPEYRLSTGVRLGPGLVSLGEPVGDVVKRIGEGDEVPVVRGTDLVRRKYPALGAQLLTSDRVLAIFLAGPSTPPLPLQRQGIGSGEASLRVGMSKADLEMVLAGKEFVNLAIDRPGEPYRYYPDPGVGARLAGDKVVELVVTQMPRRTATAE
jgi:hypothetical protein